MVTGREIGNSKHVTRRVGDNQGASAISLVRQLSPLGTNPVVRGDAHSRSVTIRGGDAHASRDGSLQPRAQFGSYVKGRGCADARRGLAFYRSQWLEHRAKMGRDRKILSFDHRLSCPRIRVLAERWRQKARAARRAFERWYAYHYDWRSWLPAKWQRIGACETGYGKRPGDWRWNSGRYQGAFGFYHGSWDAFRKRADPKAGPYPSEAYLATPRQQYEVALAIWRRYGFNGWGCRGA